MRKDLLVLMCSVLLISSSAYAGDYLKFNSPRYQSSKLDGSNFFKRLEIEIGASALKDNIKVDRFTLDSADGFYKWQNFFDSTKWSILPSIGLNFNFPLSQADRHSIYGFAFGLHGQFDPTKFDNYLNLSMPMYVYGRYGAEGSFDSRSTYSWGWGVGYTPYMLMRGDAKRLTGMPIVFIEGSKFAGGTLVKLRLTTNIYSVERYETNPGQFNNTQYWQTEKLTLFPVKLSLIWVPGSANWERNRWK